MIKAVVNMESMPGVRPQSPVKSPTGHTLTYRVLLRGLWGSPLRDLSLSTSSSSLLCRLRPLVLSLWRRSESRSPRLSRLRLLLDLCTRGSKQWGGTISPTVIAAMPGAVIFPPRAAGCACYIDENTAAVSSAWARISPSSPCTSKPLIISTYETSRKWGTIDIHHLVLLLEVKRQGLLKGPPQGRWRQVPVMSESRLPRLPNVTKRTTRTANKPLSLPHSGLRLPRQPDDSFRIHILMQLSSVPDREGYYREECKDGRVGKAGSKQHQQRGRGDPRPRTETARSRVPQNGTRQEGRKARQGTEKRSREEALHSSVPRRRTRLLSRSRRSLSRDLDRDLEWRRSLLLSLLPSPPLPRSSCW